VPAVAAARVTSSAPPVGAAVLDDRPTANGFPAIVVQVLAVAIAGVIGIMTYQYFQNRDDGDEVTGIPVRGSFHSARLSATLRLPGAGWREQTTGFDGQLLPQLGGDTSADVFLRGDDANHPDTAAMVVRYTQAGVFPAKVEASQLASGLASMESQASSLTNGAFTVSGLKCDVDDRGSAPLGVCNGSGEMLGASYDIHFYMWIPTTDDALVVVWFDKEGGGPTQAMTLVQSVRLD
jgi:hypothetical protein